MASTKQSKKIPANTCPECGSPMVYETRPDKIEYGGKERVFPMLAWWCTECDEAIFEGQPLADREKAFLELKAEVDEVLSPAQVAAVRAKLGLSQRKAGELLGGGPRSFYKYESGKQAVSVPMSHLLTLLDHDVSRLQELRGAAEHVARAEPVLRAQNDSAPIAYTKRAAPPARTGTDPVQSYPKRTVSKNEPPRRSVRRPRKSKG
ncbi:MAG TPA: type II toxin-antitoxin system MqsA family antitoxin [Polyangiaceae bacterium]|nr:type II toxin-antitoxin system MqsA family antitoxin [Polyangiaceae bacterium]